jgi:hypothetical protein
MITRQQRFYQKNHDKMLLFQQEYYETHKNDINNKNREKVYCKACEQQISFSTKPSHNKSIKHITNLKQKSSLLIENRIKLDNKLLLEFTNSLSNIHNGDNRILSTINRYKNKLAKFDVAEAVRLVGIGYQTNSIDIKIKLGTLSHINSLITNNNMFIRDFKNNKVSYSTYIKWRSFYDQLDIEPLLSISTNDSVILDYYRNWFNV